MEKMKMHSMNKIDENVKKIAALFPECITEIINEEGKLEKVVDIDAFKQLFSRTAVEGNQVRYQFTWPDKRKAKALVNQEVTSTLRPCREESVNFDTTENLYIEGDNLEVLKLLQETYLGKIKMIYIDPPYNTGHDFVYEDDFSQNANEYAENSGQYDDLGNRLVSNTESNGRFHTDWLNMIYPRLRLSKDLLTDDGIIFISINDSEIENLKKLCGEIYGERNEIATLIWDKNHSAQAGIYKIYHEYICVYCKDINLISRPTSLNHDIFEAGAMKKVSGRHPATEFTFPVGTRFDAPDGTIIEGEYGDSEKVIITKGRLVAKDGMLAEPVTLKAGFTQANQMKQFFYGDRASLVDSQGQRILEFYFNSTGKIKIVKERSVETPQTTCKFGTQGAASNELASLFGLEECPFSSPKPVNMIQDFVSRFTDTDDIVLDFFSGSATSAQAVMQVNSQFNRNLKYIMVQIAEDLDKSLLHAQKDAVRTLQVGIDFLNSIGKKHNICELGKERIRRAGKQILEEMRSKNGELFAEDSNLDIGFRDLKLDSSNMNEVYYTPDETDQRMLDGFVSNIKDDRTAEDLLFQVMLDLGVLLSAKIVEEDIGSKKVFNVDNNYLIACFDENVDENVIMEAAKKKPTYFVMRDSSLANDSVSVNFDQIFARYSPDTVRKVL